MFFLHFMLFPTFLENKILGIKKNNNHFGKTILFHLMFSLCFIRHSRRQAGNALWFCQNFYIFFFIFFFFFFFYSSAAKVSG